MNLEELDNLVTKSVDNLTEDIAGKCLVRASTTDGLCRYKIDGVQRVEGPTGPEIVFTLKS